ncbi:MAG: sulfite exporter TauE/SafE family protein [Sphingorhabdus sp.]
MSIPADAFFYIVAAIAVILVGLGKGGFAGLGAAAMPIMTLAIDPVSGAAILLPLFIVQDAVGVWAFRKSVDWRLLGWMLPGAAVGTFLGWLLAASVAVWVVEAAVGAIAIAFGANRLLAERGGGMRLGKPQPEPAGLFWGGVSGFTSQIALAGGPPFQIWALSRNLPRDVFVGTSALFFAAINWLKVPAFFALGQFTERNGTLSLLFLPLAIISTFAGVWLVRRIAAERFLTAINLLMIAVGAKLLWNAFG